MWVACLLIAGGMLLLGIAREIREWRKQRTDDAHLFELPVQLALAFQDQDGRVEQQGPHEGKQLALAHGQGYSPLPDIVIVPAGQLFYKM